MLSRNCLVGISVSSMVGTISEWTDSSFRGCLTCSVSSVVIAFSMDGTMLLVADFRIAQRPFKMTIYMTLL